MSKLTTEDLRKVVSRLPKDVLQILKNNKLIVAGGFIRAVIACEDVSDIDILAPSALDAETRAKALCAKREIDKPYETVNAYTVIQDNKIPVQFIHRWTFTDARALIDSFDFTIAQAVLWFEDGLWKSLVSDTYYSDLAGKRLHYTFPIRHEDAGGSILRVKKFLKKGYDISPEDMAKVIARLLSGIDTGSNAWNADEVGKSKVLAGLLREVDPLHIVDGIPTHECMAEVNKTEVFE